jgi:hypothetical protein
MTAGDCYRILGISASADVDEIRIAYRKLVRRYHPDATNNDPLLTERFKEVQRAYKILCNLSQSPDQFRFVVKVNVGVSTPRSRQAGPSNTRPNRSTARPAPAAKLAMVAAAIDAAVALGIPRAEAEHLVARVKQTRPNPLSPEQLLRFMLKLRGSTDFHKVIAEEDALDAAAILGIARPEAELLLARVKQSYPNARYPEQLLREILRLRSQGDSR